MCVCVDPLMNHEIKVERKQKEKNETSLVIQHTDDDD